MLPDEPGFKADTEYKRKFEELNSKMESYKQAAESARSTLRAGGQDSTAAPDDSSSAPQVNLPPLENSPAPSPITRESDVDYTRVSDDPAARNPVEFAPVKNDMLLNLPQKPVFGRRVTHPTLGDAKSLPKGPILPFSGTSAVLEVSEPATATLVYAVSQPDSYDETMTVLPAGSFVKARIVSGVEANTLEPYPVLLQLEYAFTGPNKTKVDLSNCFMIAKARANLSTERVIMETDTLSCVRQNGEHFKSSAKGYTAGEDSTFGSTGVFISKQGQVMLAAVLASIAKNAGEAVAAAQQTTTVAGFDRAQTATNVTGNKPAFIAGRATIDGAAMIAQWYLDYAKQLVPSIGIGSGQTVHVVMLETIRVPTLSE
jgi:conjugal transfer pilus assembly protein TraB